MPKPSIEDRLEIEDLFVRYATSLDAGEVEAVVACFAPDGWLESPVKGRYDGPEGIRAFARDTARLKAERGGQFRHVVSNFRIEVDGDRARARCYLLDFLTLDGKVELLSPGEYDCELAKAQGRWLFKSRLVRLDRLFPPPDGRS